MGMTRAEALANGKKRFFTGKPCVHGHISERMVSNKNCVECLRISFNNYRKKHRDALVLKSKENYAKNSEKYRKESVEYRKRNAEKVNAAIKKWKQNNRGYATFLQAERNAKKANATPKWLTETQRQQIKNVYLAAKQIRDQTAQKVVVDHIVPINGITVCGLHVPWNLCVRDHIDNSSKSNKITDDVYFPIQNGVLVVQSALPWNLKKEIL